MYTYCITRTVFLDLLATERMLSYLTWSSTSAQTVAHCYCYTVFCCAHTSVVGASISLYPLVSVGKPSKDPWHLLLEELLIHHLPSSPQGSLNALELLTELLPLPLPMEVPQVSHHHWLHCQVIAQCLAPPDIAVLWSALFGPPVIMFMPSLRSAC